MVGTNTMDFILNGYSYAHRIGETELELLRQQPVLNLDWYSEI